MAVDCVLWMFGLKADGCKAERCIEMEAVSVIILMAADMDVGGVAWMAVHWVHQMVEYMAGCGG